MNERQLEREEEQLEQDLAGGVISMTQFNKCMRDVQREHLESTEYAAMEAYKLAMEGW